MEKVVQSFNLGKITVVTIPKAFGVKPGTKIKVFKKGKNLVLEPFYKEELIEKLSGGMNFKKAFGKTLIPKELNNLYDEQYKSLLP